jgi:hypothetical protein
MLNMPPKEWLTIQIPPIPIPNVSPHPSQLPTTDSDPSPSSNEGVEVDLDPDRLTDEGGELIDKLNEWIGSDSDAGSELGEADEDDPEWDFEEGETQVKDLTYVFCPAPHRKPILHLFTKHFCQHLAFSEWNEGPCSATEIRKRAVIEMYQFCHQWGLWEAWGYLWTLWYVPPKWKLWACSTSPYVSQW